MEITRPSKAVWYLAFASFGGSRRKPRKKHSRVLISETQCVLEPGLLRCTHAFNSTPMTYGLSTVNIFF